MSEVSKNPLMNDAKKKRHLWGLWIPLIVVFSLITFPIGFAALLFYDATHVDTGITEKKDSALVFNAVMTDMFDGCRNEENPTIDLTISQTQLNQLLYNVTSEIGEDKNNQAGGFIKQFSVQIGKDQQYTFVLEISIFNVFKTTLTIETVVDSNADLGEEGNGFLFAITDLSVGRLTDTQGVLSWLAQSANAKALSNELSKKGLSITFDFDNLRITYPFTKFTQDLAKQTGSTDSLFINVFSNFFTSGMIDFEHHDGEDATGTIELETLFDNPEYTNNSYRTQNTPMYGENGDIPMLTYFSGCAEDLIDQGIIKGNSENDISTNAAIVMRFLAFGDDYLEDKEKAYITNIYPSLKDDYCDGLIQSDYSARQKDTVFGSKPDLMAEITSAIRDKIEEVTPEVYLQSLENDGEVYIFGGDNDYYTVSDQEVSAILSGNKDLIGYGYLFKGNYPRGQAKLSYTMLDNVYATLLPGNVEKETKDAMCITFGLNLNGAQTSLVMPMEATEIHGTKSNPNAGVHGFSFDLKNAPIYYGIESFSDLKEQLRTTINRVRYGNQDSMIDYVVDENGNVKEITMLFDFDKWFTDNHIDDEEPTDSFVKFHKRAISDPYNAKLVVDFEIKPTSQEASNHSGYFTIKVGYKVPDTI